MICARTNKECENTSCIFPFTVCFNYSMITWNDKYGSHQQHVPFGWQPCPICNGEAKIAGQGKYAFEVCPTCNGKRIISISNGLPPQ